MVVRTMQTEQRHNHSSPYSFPELPNSGHGAPVGYTGKPCSCRHHSSLRHACAQQQHLQVLLDTVCSQLGDDLVV